MFIPHKAYSVQEKITCKLSQEELSQRKIKLEDLLEHPERDFIFYTVSPKYCFLINLNKTGIEGFFDEGIQWYLENDPIKALNIPGLYSRMQDIQNWIKGLMQFLETGEDLGTDNEIMKNEFIYKEIDPHILLTHPSKEVRQWFKKQQVFKNATDTSISIV